MSALGQKRTFRSAISHVRFTPKSGHGIGGSPTLGGAIMRCMKVEEIAEAIAKLPPDQLAPSVAGSPHSRRAAAITPRSSTPPRPNLAASLAARLLN